MPFRLTSQTRGIGGAHYSFIQSRSAIQRGGLGNGGVGRFRAVVGSGEDGKLSSERDRILELTAYAEGKCLRQWGLAKGRAYQPLRLRKGVRGLNHQIVCYPEGKYRL